MKKLLPTICTISIFLIFMSGLILILKSTSVEEVLSQNKEEIIFSRPGGFYSESFSLNLESKDEALEIRYTLDGSEPDVKSRLYTDPIKITDVGRKDEVKKYNVYGVVIRAGLFKDSKRIGKVITNSYIIGKNIEKRFNMAVVSISTDNKNLYDYEKGIYVPGKVFDEWRKKNPNAQVNGSSPANYNQKGMEWERPIHVEFYEPDGTRGFSQDAGVRVLGGWTRETPQKSLRLFARSEYDEQSRFDYSVFPGLKSRNGDGRLIDSFKRLILRNSGNDFWYTSFRDAVMQKLAENEGIDIQVYRPAVVFINGHYWGIQNLRNDNDENYIESNYGADKSKIAIMKNSYELDYGVKGDEKHYRNTMDYAWKNDLSIKENYEKFNTMMDVENFMKYVTFEIFYSNGDWPHNNIRMWRYKTEKYESEAPYGLDGRWRWMLKDTDFGFSLYGTNYNVNTLETTASQRAKDMPLWPLLQNNNFKIKFINYFADMLNTALSTENATKLINEAQFLYAPEMQNQIERWGTSWGKIENWYNNINIMREFAEKRPEYMRSFIKDYFNLTGTANVSAKVETSGGKIEVNSVEINDAKKTWKGIYFTNIPIQISAVPDEGYKLSSWTIDGRELYTDSITINLTKDTKITASFEKLTDEKPIKDVFINEIMSSDQKEGNTDWIELYNPSENKVSLEDYYLSDDKENLKKWQFSASYIKAKGYLRIWCSGRDLRNPAKELHTNFSIKEGEEIYLTKYDGSTIIDNLKVVKTFEKQSFGRYPDGGRKLIYLDKPTPGKTNSEKQN